jgi:hypothetical protein
MGNKLFVIGKILLAMIVLHGLGDNIFLPIYELLRIKFQPQGGVVLLPRIGSRALWGSGV